MSNKTERETKEMQNLFSDPKFARKAWQHVGHAIANSPASKPFTSYDKDGNPTLQSDIEAYSYAQLHKDLESLGNESRGPTELEMILKCQMIRARYDTSAAVFVRDTIGAKPVDETKLDAQVNNPYETLSDEELEALAAMRAAKKENNDE